MKRKISLLVVLLLAFSVLSGCMSRSKKTVYTPFGKTTVTTNSGGKGKSITEAQLGAPVYPSAVFVTAAESESNIMGKKMRIHVTTLSTKDPASSVETFYKSRYPSAQAMSQATNGQQITTLMTNPPTPTQTMPSDSLMIQIMSDPKGRGTMINVMKMKM